MSPASGTRRGEMLLQPEVMRQPVLLRRLLSAVGQIEGTELLLQRLGKTKPNEQLLTTIAKAMEAAKRLGRRSRTAGDARLHEHARQLLLQTTLQPLRRLDQRV